MLTVQWRFCSPNIAQAINHSTQCSMLTSSSRYPYCRSRCPEFNRHFANTERAIEASKIVEDLSKEVGQSDSFQLMFTVQFSLSTEFFLPLLERAAANGDTDACIQIAINMRNKVYYRLGRLFSDHIRASRLITRSTAVYSRHMPEQETLKVRRGYDATVRF